MEGNRKVDGPSLPRHFFNAGHNAAGRNSHIAVTDALSLVMVHQVKRCQHIFKVQHGFSASHDDNTADTLSLGDEKMIKIVKLGKDFPCREITHEPMETAGAKGTVHGAAHLTGKACAVPIVMMHKDRFDRRPVRKTQKDFVGEAVRRIIRAKNFYRAGKDCIGVCKKGSVILGKVRHFFKGRGPFFIDPAKNLLRPKLLES